MKKNKLTTALTVLGAVLCKSVVGQTTIHWYGN